MGAVSCGSQIVTKIIDEQMRRPQKKDVVFILLPFRNTSVKHYFNQVRHIGKTEFKINQLAYSLSEQTLQECWEEDGLWDEDSDIVDFFKNYLPNHSDEGMLSLENAS